MKTFKNYISEMIGNRKPRNEANESLDKKLDESHIVTDESYPELQISGSRLMKQWNAALQGLIKDCEKVEPEDVYEAKSQLLEDLYEILIDAFGEDGKDFERGVAGSVMHSLKPAERRKLTGN